MPAPAPARRAALALLAGVMTEGRMLSDLTGPALDRLPAAERATALRLTTGTLRGLGPIDRLLSAHLSRRPPGPVLRVLQLATFELATGGAAHGVVNDAVLTVGGLRKHRHLKGLVNAVLRKIADQAPAKWSELPPTKMPGWLRKPVVAKWGAQTALAIEKAHAAPAPIDLTALHAPDTLAQATGGQLLPTGSVRLAPSTQVSALPGYDSGAFWVQDAAAALPVRLAGPVRGLRVLDLCAAPGGKSLQFAAAGAEVTAVDLSAKRMQRVQENLARTGLSADIQICDAFDVTGQWDLVLLDAPCSATGTLRRHPDLPFVKTGDSPAALAALQSRLLDHALTLLAPGGRLIFCTCSLLPGEGEDQITAALTRHPGLSVAPPKAKGLEPSWITPEGGLRLRPDLWANFGGMDGFFMAVLRQ